MMKTSLLIALLASAIALADSKLPFDYPELIPAAPITLQEAKIILARADAIKEQVTDKLNDIKKVKSEQLAGWVEHKKKIIQKAQNDIDTCQQDSNCVSQVNKKLTTDISLIHEKLREVNTFYDKKIIEEDVVVARKFAALKQVLEANKNAVIINSLKEELKRPIGNQDFILETNPNLDTALSAKSATQYLNEITRSMYWNVSDGYAYAVSSFYFRTSKAENHVFLTVTPFFGQSYADLKTELLDPNADSVKSVFGINKATMVKELINTGGGEYIFNPTCMGYEEVKTKACIAVLKNDSVSLQ